MEWAIEVAAGTCLPVAATMCIGPQGDMHGVSAADCAVRMANAGKTTPHYTGWSKKLTPFVLYTLISSNIDRFSNLFHCQNQENNLASPAMGHWGTCPPPPELGHVKNLGSFYVHNILSSPILQ